MKVPDSGMPDQDYWESLFNITLIMDWLHPLPSHGPIVEIGCGYGTFTRALAGASCQPVITFDIEAAMVHRTLARVAADGNAGRVKASQRDVLADGTGMPNSSCGMVLLFNILHFPERRELLAEAARILVPGGSIAIIHWRRDVPTPRGPLVDLRPGPAEIRAAIEGLPLSETDIGRILEPWHWGIKLKRLY